jgi:hypothetical protein
MGAVATIDKGYSEVTLLHLAREIAKNINPIELVLENNKISPEEYEDLKNHRHFTDLVASEVAAWNAATNTAERLKLKSLSMCEEWLAEANARIHDRQETLAAKNETIKVVAAFAGVGKSTVNEPGSSERFTVTINLGADHKLQFTKDVTPKVIEGASPTE